MRFHEIVDFLRKRYDVDVLSSDFDIEIRDVRLLDPEDENMDDRTLYFSYKKQTGELPYNIMLTSDCGPEKPPEHDMNLAQIPADDFIPIFNAAQDMVDRHKRNDFRDYMMEVADRVRGVDTFIDIASQSFGASLVLIDANYRVVTDKSVFHALKPPFAVFCR